MPLLLLFAFLAGLVTILSPCILPILPIVLSGSLSGGKKRPLGIVTGFIGSFTFFTLALATIVQATGVSADSLRLVSVIIIFAFGLSLLLPQTQVLLEKLFSKFAGLAPSNQDKEGFGGGILVGLSLGLIWTPCVGPILASVITLALSSQVGFSAFFITLAYSLGTALPMLGITYGGRNLLNRVPWLLRNTTKIQKGFGVLMMLTALGIFLNVDRQFQSYILEKFPQYGAGLTALEDNELVNRELEKLQNTEGETSPKNINQLQNMKDNPYILAPDFNQESHWINSEPLSLKEELKGKVVLVDFWTYSCINCIRTFPYLRSWYEKYKDQDFVIVGVHAPEFEFEKETKNVEKAVKDFELTYPVVQDNDFKTWRAYNNRFWPAHYLIDKDGYIRYTHFGEGKYVETENKIRELLGEEAIQEKEEVSERKRLTPETYLGYGRAQSYTNENDIEIDTTKTYQLSKKLPQNAVGLNGDWYVGEENITAQKDGSSLSLDFTANKVFLVMDTAKDQTSPATVTLKLDGEPLPEKYFTVDMNENGEIVISEPRKYDLVDLKEDYGNHVLEITFSSGGEAFAFTFG